MKKILFVMFALIISFTSILYGSDKKKEENNIKILIKVGEKKLTATLINNATSRALITKFPLTILLKDLYNREMCYNFSEDLPTDAVKYTDYEVGDIIYWPPRHSFVIMYAQNGERFAMQKIGRIDSYIEILKNIGDITVTLEVVKQNL